MSTNASTIQAYASAEQWRTIPEHYQAIGEIADEKGNRMLAVFFTTHRDLIQQIGYSASDSCPDVLRACTAVACELAKDQPVVAAHLLGPAQITEKLCGDDEPDDQTFYFSVLATLALKKAISSYADYRKADYAAWKAEQAKKEGAATE